MFSHLVFLASSVLSVLTSPSTALPSPLNLDSSSRLHQPAGLDSRTTNTTSLANPVVSYTPECGFAYGRNLNRASCEDALSKISQVTTAMTFGERGTGNWDVILPRRYLSGMSILSDYCDGNYTACLNKPMRVACIMAARNPVFKVIRWDLGCADGTKMTADAPSMSKSAPTVPSEMCPTISK